MVNINESLGSGKAGTGSSDMMAGRTAVVHLFNELSTKRPLPKFKKLWNGYPQGKNGMNAAPSNDGYKNQCAIRTSVTLEKAGYKIDDYPKVNQTTEGWARSSKGLADFIWQKSGRPLIMGQDDFEKNYRHTSQGIMFLKAPSGGISHIDLNNHGQAGSGYYQADEVWYWELD